jgi:2-phosphoglycerate kinase
VLAGFLEQTRNVLVGVRASIERALEEGWSMVLEGVHLVPGMLPPIEGASSSSACSRSRTRRAQHALHGARRRARRACGRTEVHRPLDDIRRIQDHIVRGPRAHRVP